MNMLIARKSHMFRNSIDLGVEEHGESYLESRRCCITNVPSFITSVEGGSSSQYYFSRILQKWHYK